ncbi:MAG: leucyl aminopeptidase [Burkholderiales bacterium]|nr:leucyl aminopeptidase [Burkholderiales bacterium]
MDFRHQTLALQDLASADADALLLIIGAEPKGLALPGPLQQLIQDAFAAGDFAIKPGRALYLHQPAGMRAKRVVVAACAGAAPKAVRAALARALAAVKELGGVKQIAVASAGCGAWTRAQALAVAVAVGEASYVYGHTKSTAPKPPAWKRVTLLTPAEDAAEAREGLRRGQAIAAGMTFAREQANRPGNFCTPTLLADAAKALAKQHGLGIQVFDRAGIEKIGMGSFLSVARGSEEPPRFIVLRYDGAAKSEAPIVLVGKGVTFDTGGISLKPGAEMDEMKFDMGGAASVLGTFRAVAELKPRINLVGLIPATENMPSGRATKPGDVVTSLSGQTIEILNTDAEGRLILCDALTYAERFKPACVVDIATLTGACVIALGHHNSGLFSPDDELAQSLLDAGREALDPAWRMPLDEEYDEQLKSNFADMANIGGRAAGSVTAAMFLKRFTKAYRWAHLDIAGTAWKSGAAKGGTGRPVPLLTSFVLAQADSRSATRAGGRRAAPADAPATPAAAPAGRRRAAAQPEAPAAAKRASTRRARA